jgi:hypothetical protein
MRCLEIPCLPSKYMLTVPFFIQGETRQKDGGKLSVSIPINGTM